MSIIMAAYDMAAGFNDAAAPTFGPWLGRLKVERARKVFRVIQLAGMFACICISLIVQFFREDILTAMTNMEEIHSEASAIMSFIVLNTIPELYKGLMKGAIYVLRLQDHLVWIHFLCNWVLNLSLQYYLICVCGYRLAGIWIAKIVMEWCIICL